MSSSGHLHVQRCLFDLYLMLYELKKTFDCAKDNDAEEKNEDNVTEQTHHIIVPSYSAWLVYNRKLTLFVRRLSVRQSSYTAKRLALLWTIVYIIRFKKERKDKQ